MIVNDEAYFEQGETAEQRAVGWLQAFVAWAEHALRVVDLSVPKRDRRIPSEQDWEDLGVMLAESRAVLNEMGRGPRQWREEEEAARSGIDIANMSIRAILVRLAERGNGKLRGLDAVKTLMGAGVFPDRKSADAQVYTLLNRSPEFEKVRPGEYRLVGAARAAERGEP